MATENNGGIKIVKKTSHGEKNDCNPVIFLHIYLQVQH